MRKFILIGLCFLSIKAMADESLDPRVVAEAARQMQLTEAEVRELALHGCDSASTYDMGGCSSYWFIAEDFTMNELFKQLMAGRKGKPQQKLLLSAQRSWLAFRDASCAFEASGYLGGTLAKVENLQCMTKTTESRNAQLREYASCSADGGCP